MDRLNRFDSRLTFLIMRLEYLFALGVCIALALVHIDEIRWIPFVALFAYIDIVGYLPGAIAYRMEGGAPIPRVYYVLYNTTHNFVFNGLIVGLWWLSNGPEWSLLAIPIHLFGDRSLFGNVFKPFGISFEPSVHAAFAHFEREYGN